jgi:uncharacterized protein YeaO (DUF488 family)
VIKTKRVYDPPSPEDGYRLLVMRLWPRGVTKAAVDAWEKDLGPSRELLSDFRSGGVGWEEYAACYRQEVSARAGLLARYRDLARRETLTLLCACQDEARCHRSLLKEILESE